MKPRYSAILLESDPVQRDLMALALQNLGCTVQMTCDSAEARGWLKQAAPDLLVLDTFLPQTNGLDLLRSFHTEHLLEETRVMVVSAFGFGDIVKQVAQLGAQACLIKPLDLKVFSARARVLLALKPADHNARG
jgi:DNA-binding response OmpR family regulator